MTDLPPSERIPILNAYSLPGVESAEALYPTISPANSFPVVLNRSVESSLPLLADESYFAPNQDYDRLTPFPNGGK